MTCSPRRRRSACGSGRRSPLISVVTHEEEYALSLVREVAFDLSRDLAGLGLWQWSVASGLRDGLVDTDKRGLGKYSPLADWTEADLWRHIFAHELPYHPLHDQGYASIGCWPCTEPATDRSGRWAGSGKTECGLHL